MADDSAVFGRYPSSGRRPEALNVSRNVNAPLQLLRGAGAGVAGTPGDIEAILRAIANFSFGLGGVKVSPEAVLPTSERIERMIPGRDESPAGQLFSGLGALAGGVKGSKWLVQPSSLRRELHNLSADVMRPFTPVPVTIEAVSPKLGQKGTSAFREGLTERLIGEEGAYPIKEMGRHETSRYPGQGVFKSPSTGILETNPMISFEVPGISDISRHRTFLKDLTSAGSALEQEGMGAVRFLPSITNNIKDASAMLIKPKGRDLSPEEVIKLSTMLGENMVLSHNPRLGGVTVVPFGAVKQGEVPSEFLAARQAAKDVLGNEAKIHYGTSDYNRDRIYGYQTPEGYKATDIKGEKYLLPKAQPTPEEVASVRDRLKYLERKMFPESVEGIPGQVQSAPVGGIQPWSRGKEYPTDVIGRESQGRTMWQPVNYATEEYGELFPKIREADEARKKMLEDWQRWMPSQVR